jgi:hypothetical protein
MAQFGPHWARRIVIGRADGGTGDDVEGFAGGLGSWLIQWATIIHGLWTLLALTAVFVLPLALFSVLVGAVLAVPYVAFRVGARLIARARHAGPE